MTTPTWPQITSAAASLSTVGGAHQIVAAALLNYHRSLQPESEHDMTDAREAAIAQIDGRYDARRDSEGNIRLSRGHGALVARPTDIRADVQGWFDRASGPKWARMYRAALDLLDAEAADTNTKEN